QDRVVKAWDAERMVERKVFERQGETVLSMALRPDGKQLALGRYDGQVVFIDTATGQATAATVTSVPQAAAAPTALQEKPAKPDIKKITPSEGRRGQPIRIIFDGNHLDNVSDLVLPSGASGKIVSKSAMKLEAEIAFPATTPASVQQISVKNGAGQSAPLSFVVNPFPAIAEREGNDS